MPNQNFFLRTSARSGVALLILASALNRFGFNLLSVTVRPEHLAFVLVAVFWITARMRARRRPLLLWDDWLLALYVLIACVASVFNAPQPLESLRFVGLMIFGVLLYVLVRDLAAEPRVWQFGVVVLLLVAGAQALLGIVTWALFPFGLNFGIREYFWGFADLLADGCNYTFAPSGTLHESNIFASYVAAGSLLALVFLLSRTRTIFPRFVGFIRIGKFSNLALTALWVLMLIALGLALSRGAWLGLAAGLAWVVWQVRTPSLAARVSYGLGAVSIVLVAVAVSVQLSPTLIRLPQATRAEQIAACEAQRQQARAITAPATVATPTATPTSTRPFASITRAPTRAGTPQPTAVPKPTRLPTVALPAVPSGLAPLLERALLTRTLSARLEVYLLALNDWQQHPWLGHGANAFVQNYRDAMAITEITWVSNLFLMALYDTGLVGLIVLASWFVALAWAVVRRRRGARSQLSASLLDALIASSLALLVAYQFTSALWLGVTWVYLGLLRAGIITAEAASDDGEDVGAPTRPSAK